jgi:hypothetical protein
MQPLTVSLLGFKLHTMVPPLRIMDTGRDFNVTLSSHDRSNQNIDWCESIRFDQTINSLGLLDLTLKKTIHMFK